MKRKRVILSGFSLFCIMLFGIDAGAVTVVNPIFLAGFYLSEMQMAGDDAERFGSARMEAARLIEKSGMDTIAKRGLVSELVAPFQDFRHFDYERISRQCLASLSSMSDRIEFIYGTQVSLMANASGQDGSLNGVLPLWSMLDQYLTLSGNRTAGAFQRAMREFSGTRPDECALVSSLREILLYYDPAILHE